MKIVFLDIDGVLNTATTLPLKENLIRLDGIVVGFNQLDKNAIAQLNRVTDTTGAKIVISSSWRIGCSTPEKFGVLCEYLKQQGVKAEIIGRTPIYSEYCKQPGIIAVCFARGDEIQLWLNEHLEVKDFVIVDDNSDMEHLTNKLVMTEFEVGITKEKADEMICMLS